MNSDFYPPGVISIYKDTRALIFDCDGTLVDSMPWHMQAWRQAFARSGIHLDEKFISSRRGMKETDIVREYNRTFGTGLAADKLVGLKHEIFLVHISQLKPIEPVVNVAKSYHGRLPLGVVSGGTREVVSRELNAIGIMGLFKVVLTADDPYKAKPDPEIFLAASHALGVEPQFCLVFEDGEAGLDGALKAGMKTIDVRTFLDET